MPPKRKTRTPRPYGMQGATRTIKSLALDVGLAEWAEKEATKRGIPFSTFITELVEQYRSKQTITQIPPQETGLRAAEEPSTYKTQTDTNDQE